MSYIARVLATFSDTAPEGTDKNDKNPPPPVFVVFVSASPGACAESPLPGEPGPARPLEGPTVPPKAALDNPVLPPWPPRPAELAEWPVEWRARWGRRANELQDQGIPWPDHERRAFAEVKAAMSGGAICPP